jgi:predicted alpha/beta-hydrolase family hydrolase
MAIDAAAVLLTHGAGSDRRHRTLVALEEALAPRPCVRHDFPYRRAGKKFPDRAPLLVADVNEAATALATSAGVAPDQVLLGGRSLGGRMCSMAVAEGLPAAGLVLISYPLHPPGKPDKPRVEHLPQITVPTLFISGNRDSFGTPEELEAAASTITGPVTHVWIEGGRHELSKVDDQIVAAVLSWLDAPGPRRPAAKRAAARKRTPVRGG